MLLRQMVGKRSWRCPPVSHLAASPVPDRIDLCRAAHIDEHLPACLLGGLDHKSARWQWRTSCGHSAAQPVSPAASCVILTSTHPGFGCTSVDCSRDAGFVVALRCRFCIESSTGASLGNSSILIIPPSVGGTGSQSNHTACEALHTVDMRQWAPAHRCSNVWHMQEISPSLRS